jgi:hypothetical protein
MRRSWPSIAVLLAASAVACIDIAAPNVGVASITRLILPSPSVVLGDVMRDSAGNPAQAQLFGFDRTGAPIEGLAPSFLALDPEVRFDASGFIFGDSLGNARIVGTIGNIQTPPETVTVTVPPDTITAASSVDTLNAKLGGDSLQASGPMTVALNNRDGAAVQRYLVRYTVIYSPVAQPGQGPTAFIGNSQKRLSPVDTTDSNGGASRIAVLRLLAVGDAALLGGQKTDSIVVEVSAQYKGAPVPGGPLRFTIPVRVGIAP